MGDQHLTVPCRMEGMVTAMAKSWLNQLAPSDVNMNLLQHTK